MKKGTRKCMHCLNYSTEVIEFAAYLGKDGGAVLCKDCADVYAYAGCKEVEE